MAGGSDVILYDGVCALCNRFVRFVIARDGARRFRFASLQSAFAARVLLGDMAGLGLVTVHQTASSAGNAPDLALMERVLSGLRRL